MVGGGTERRRRGWRRRGDGKAARGVEAAHAVKLLWFACVVWGHGWREQHLRQEEESLPSAVI